MAVGGWFVPCLNFVRPKQIMNDTWGGLSPEDYAGDDWRGRLITPLLHWWWGLWIVGGLLSYTSFSAPADPSAAESEAIRWCMADVLYAIGSALAIVIVTRVHRAPGAAGDRAHHSWSGQPMGACGLARTDPRHRNLWPRLRRLRRSR